ncbi:THUMP domain-containing class I SAM-dependent RNA methyltransferase [Jannaschia aquimarina]|nr:RNA methyltransferase [Jannaschia aquimarina]
MEPLSVFLAAPAGLEPQLLDEAREIGLKGPKAVSGGVECDGGWEAVRRANLRSRIASRVLARIARFDARGFPALIAGFRAIDWSAWLPAGVGVTVDATSVRSRASHGGAVARHLGEALARSGTEAGDDFRILARLERDICTISLDTSGEPLHRRGYKQRVNRAPLRETLAAGFLRAAGYRAGEPLLDPMCGSGTFVIEAAEIARGLRPGRMRGFAFERLPSHDAGRWDALRAMDAVNLSILKCHGSDRDAGAVQIAKENAASAGMSCSFECRSISDVVPPEGAAGLVITNPPYGTRIGDRRLEPLYGTFGRIMRERFGGWRIAMVTSEDGLARATGLDWDAPGPYVDHGGLKVRLWQTAL